jgi:hypothetical protein
VIIQHRFNAVQRLPTPLGSGPIHQVRCLSDEQVPGPHEK